jgi:glycosyltransferase involved in cell wall biosynthesis
MLRYSHERDHAAAIALTSPITVAVCTFNRCASLARTLGSLAEQRDVAWPHFEVFVVDNNCTDNTARVVDAFRDRLPIQRVVETSQGLSFARNRALAEAPGDWVLFTDDDVTLDENWLTNYARALTQAKDFDFAGGRILPGWGGRPPRWFKGERLDLLDGVLVWFDLGQDLRALTAEDPLPFGASFAVRRSLTQRIGSFRIDLGVRGQVPGRGEETELMRRAHLAGAKGLYVGNALCWHAVDPTRLTFRALLRYGKASGIAYKAIENPSQTGSRASAALYLARGLVQLAKGRGDRFRQCVINAGAQLALASKR